VIKHTKTPHLRCCTSQNIIRRILNTSHIILLVRLASEAFLRVWSNDERLNISETHQKLISILSYRKTRRCDNCLYALVTNFVSPRIASNLTRFKFYTGLLCANEQTPCHERGVCSFAILKSMRLVSLILLFVAVLFGSGFWYNHIDIPCKIPIHYRIGNIDERFGTSYEEIRRIAGEAERLWENPLSAELFVYDDSLESLPINLLYDERQQTAEREAEIRADLDAKEGMSENVGAQYERLITEFRSLKKRYESQVVAYETKLDAYNAEVLKWNNKGGAPQAVIDDLKTGEASLKSEQSELELLAKKLNSLTTELNKIGARGNELITDYNSIVEKYNSEFSSGHEFTQGDYKRDAITIYQFDSEEELTIVLAHEFGHALALGHVQNEKSIMYHLMENQSVVDGVSAEDSAEYARVCTEKTIFEKILNLIGNSFAL
jgi:hypothetical protein